MSERTLFALLDELSEMAECRLLPDLHTGPDVFETEAAAERDARTDAAKEVCEDCPVWEACLEYALRIQPTYGVWAGHTPGELTLLCRKARAVAMAEAA